MMYREKITEVFEKITKHTYWKNAEQKLEDWALWLNRNNISPNLITLIGLMFAILGLNFLAIESYFLAFICLVFNRLCDILDGISARQKQITPYGAFFDIFADYTSYALFVLGFILANPADNGSAGAFLLVTLLISVAALLGLSITSDKSFKELNASKVNICMWGTLQNADSFVALLLMCLFSGLFVQLAIFFGLLLLGKSLLLVSTAYYNLNIAYRPKKKK